MSTGTEHSSGQERDSADLARFGYSQELKRSLGLVSSFAVAFSYISPSTGIFTLFALGLTTLGGVFIWTWPVVALGQFIVALNFAEVSSHYPVAGSVFQWTKYLASRSYSWFTGWIYLFAGILTVTAVVATLPLALIPALNGLGWHSLNAASLHTQLVVALITLVVITVLNIYGVRLVAVINNTGVLFEILGMFVFALVLLAFHNHQGFHVVTNSAGFQVNGELVPGRDVHEPVRDLRLRHRVDAGRGDPRPPPGRAQGGAVLGDRRVHHRRRVPARHAGGDPEHGRRGEGRVRARADHRGQLLHRFRDPVPARGLGRDLRLLPVDPGRDDQAVLRHVARQPAAGLRGAGQGLPQPAHSGVDVRRRSRVLAAIPFLKYSGAATIAIAATGMIYLSYFLGNIVIMRARVRGWPKVSAPFRLGRWGLLVNVVALLYGGAMLVNFAWPRAASNPKPEQTGGLLELRAQLPEQDPDPVDGGGRHRADRGHLLPGGRADQGVRAGDGTVRRTTVRRWRRRAPRTADGRSGSR